MKAPGQRTASTLVSVGRLAIVWSVVGAGARAQKFATPKVDGRQPAASASPLIESEPRTEAQQALADIVGRIIEGAIPTEYEKQKDWGATKNVPVGVRVEGKFLHTHVHKRTKPVNHGVWKHYKLRMVEPEQNLAVRVTALRSDEPGRYAATIEIEAVIDAWARARVYQYGVHVISVEIEADARVRLTIDGKLAVRWNGPAWFGSAVIDPTAHAARLEVTEFRLRRVSEARGPLVGELSGGVRKLIENELDGPQLTAKVNRAIERKRDRLTLSPRDLLEGAWKPFGEMGMTSPAAAQ